MTQKLLPTFPTLTTVAKANIKKIPGKETQREKISAILNRKFGPSELYMDGEASYTRKDFFSEKF